MYDCWYIFSDLKLSIFFFLTLQRYMIASILYDIIVYETIKKVIRASVVSKAKNYAWNKLTNAKNYLERIYYKKK